MLKLSKFTGHHPSDAHKFWTELKTFLTRMEFKNITGTPTLDDVKEVYFYDTKGSCALYKHNLILRKRVVLKNGTMSNVLTLKARNNDRYISGNIILVNNKTEVGVNTKFEEDIKPPFMNSFSYSASTTIQSEFVDLKNLSHIYTNIENLGFNFLHERLYPIGGVYSRTYKKMEFLMAEDYMADVILTMWFDMSHDKLGIAELGFKLKSKREDYSYEVARRAKDMYKELQMKFDWGDTKSTFKTQWIYRRTTVCRIQNKI